MCSVLGLFVRQSDPRLRDVNVRVYIANHVTQFDHNVINLLTSCNTVSNLELSTAGLEAPGEVHRELFQNLGVAMVLFSSYLLTQGCTSFEVFFSVGQCHTSGSHAKIKEGKEEEEMLEWVLILLKGCGQILASLSFSGHSSRWCQKRGWLWGFPSASGAGCAAEEC